MQLKRGGEKHTHTRTHTHTHTYTHTHTHTHIHTQEHTHTKQRNKHTHTHTHTHIHTRGTHTQARACRRFEQLLMWDASGAPLPGQNRVKRKIKETEYSTQYCYIVAIYVGIHTYTLHTSLLHIIIESTSWF